MELFPIVCVVKKKKISDDIETARFCIGAMHPMLLFLENSEGRS